MAPNIFTCFIIGEDNLHLECAKIIQQQGQQIIGIISAYEAAELWALQQGIPHYASLAAAQEALNKTPFDYLFSIVNSQILPAAILNLPRQLAINFHDAPLPRYAGVHATSWAILNQEKTHGITWHVAIETVDAGDILQQVMVPITEDETALSLNLKCYEGALQSFPELVKSLVNHSYQRQPQDLSQRTYFGFHQKPAGDGWIDWNASAEAIERLFRATQFGSYPNRFTCPKFRLSSQQREPSSQQGSWEEFIVTKLALLPEPSIAAPGTIVAATADYWRIATASYDIAIRQICTLEGDVVTLEVGAEIPPLSFETLRSSGRMGGRGDLNSGGGDEAHWVSQWQTIEPAKIPFLNFNHRENKSSFLLPLWEKVAEGRIRGEPSEPIPRPPAYPEPVEGALSPTRGEGIMPEMYERGYYHLQQWTPPEPLQKLLQHHFPAHDFNTLLLALWLVYLYRLGNQPKVGVLLQLAYHNASHPSDLDPGIYARTSLELPYFTALQDGLHFGQVVTQLQAELLAMQQKGGYLRDIFYRYPNLIEVKHAVFTAVVIGEIDQLQKSRAALVLMISAKDGSVSWHVDQKCLAQEPYLKTILQQMPGHLETLLTAITMQPETPIADLALLTPQEQQQILIDWNQTETDYPRDKTIPQLFEEQVKKHPNKIAVCFENQSLSYRELNQKANQLAHYLRQQGVVAETLVAICMERSIEMIVGILGILKSGGAYVPIDPEYPRARIKFIFEDCRAMFVITQFRLAKKIHTITDGAVITVDKIKNIKIHNKESISLNFDSSQLAYVIYTSGTTGKPKGVLIKHQGVVNTVLAKLRKFAINHSDRILNFSTLSFDASVWEIFPCLFAGATLYLARKENLLPGSKLTNFLEQNKITIATLVPSILAITPPPSTSHLRIIISAGESCSKAVVKQWENVPVFVNAYGPTEFTICAAMAIVGKDAKKITIGRPIPNTKIFILDDNMQPLPMGITGELYVTGHGLAKGYLNRDALTKSKFIPWALEHGTNEVSQIVYKTGDLARWLPDGNLEYMGRVDEQIKILGCRAELGELEEIAVTYPNILQAAACLDTTAEKNQINLFFIKKSNRNAIDIAKFNRFLKKQVPRYTVPSKIIEIARFPRTVNGKIDKNLLLKKPSLINEQAVEGPMSVKETLLLKIFQKLLGIDSLNLEDNFFFLGGDSILAMHLISKINALGFQCSVRDVFEAPTIKKLVKKLHEKTAIKPTEPLAKDFTLTPIQHWFFEQSFTHPQQFVQTCWLEFQKTVDAELLLCCLREIIEWHEIFRLRFKKEQGNWQQYYADKVNELCANFSVIDDPALVVQNFASEWAMNVAQDFDFETGYLLKVALVRQQGQITHLLLVAHHLIMDGVSWQIFLDELQSLYVGSKEEESANWQKFANSTSYQQWVYALDNYVASNSFKQEQGYWQGIGPFTPIPIDHQRGINTEFFADSVTIKLTAGKTYQLLRTLARTHHLNVEEILIALLVKTLIHWCQTDYITLDIERHGREELTKAINLSGTLGWFTSVVSLQLSCNIGLSLLEIVQMVQEQLKTLPYHGIGYGLRQYSEKKSFKQQAQIAFNYWGQLDQAFAQNFFSLGELKLLSHPENKRPYLITIDAVIKNKQLELSWIYSRNYHRRETIEKLTQYFLADLKDLLSAKFLTEHFPTTISSFPEVSAQALEQIAQTYAKSEIKNIYPLAPLQKGLLFHALESPTSEAYAVQLVWKSEANKLLSIERLQKAFDFVVNRHDALRTSFIWEHIEQPLQIVWEKVQTPWTHYDWSAVHLGEEQQQRLEVFLRAERQSGFDFHSSGLLRGTVFNLPEHRHYIVITLHHILIDGWSLPLMLQEVSHHYEALEQLNFIPAKQYGDYIQWLQQQDSAKAKVFWTEYLRGFSSPTVLEPLMKSHGPKAGSVVDIQEHRWNLEEVLMWQITRFVQENHLTLSVFFQGIWGLLLQHYSQSDDVVFGVTVTTRDPTMTQAEQIVGLMINTLPMRIAYQNNQPLTQYLAQIQANFAQVLPYHSTALSDIQEWSEVPNDQPLFDSILIVENYLRIEKPTTIMPFNEVRIIEPTHYPLTCIIVPGKQGAIQLNYDQNRIFPGVIQQLQQHFNGLIGTFLQQPQQLLHEISLLTSEERQRLLVEWNKTQFPFASQSVPALFEQQVSKTSHQVALVYEEQIFTYRELNQRANQLAHYLRSRGIQAEQRVAVCLPRSPTMVISLLAILKAGGAYVPIDATYPKERLRYLLADSEPNLLLTFSGLQESLNSLGFPEQQIIFVDEEPLAHYSADNLRQVISPQQLMYLIYTSGSTGKPKGVMVEHGAVSNFLHAMQQKIAISNQDSLLAVTSLSFDIATLELFLPLISGAKCVVANQETVTDGWRLKELLEKQQISLLQATPMTWKMLLEVGWSGGFLRTVLCGGEALSLELAQQLLKRSPVLWNLYGPTEATVWSTAARITADMLNAANPIIPLGKPIANTQVYVLNPHRHSVPEGVSGELYIGGAGIARGYFNRPELTEEKFIPNPFDLSGATRLYRTGDLVRWLADGSLEFLGRTDDQVKLRGFRIELGEIEACLLQHGNVKQAVVLPIEPACGELVAYVIPKQRCKLDSDLLRRYLKQQLPAFMIPSQWWLIDRIPYTSHGKIDKKQLRTMAHNTQKPSLVTNRSTITPVEKELLMLWQHLFKAQLSINDNFFELGGHSLRALQLLALIKNQLHINLKIQDLFTAPTVAELAKIIQQHQAGGIDLSTVPRQKQTNCMITLNPQGTLRPLFLIHPIGGTVFWYTGLTKYIRNRPIYAIQDPGIEIRPIPCQSVEELAQYYVELIQQVQPQGPYLLAGASAGGNLCVVMSQLLQKKGQKVAFVGLFDSWVPYPEMLLKQEYFEANMRRQYHNLCHQFPVQSIPNLANLLQLEWYRLQMHERYQLSAIDVKLTLFKAATTIPVYQAVEEASNHWDHYCQQPIEKYVIPGDHETIFQEPNLSILGKILNHCLEQAEVMPHIKSSHVIGVHDFQMHHAKEDQTEKLSFLFTFEKFTNSLRRNHYEHR